MNPIFAARVAQAVNDLQEALSVTQPAQPQTVPQPNVLQSPLTADFNAQETPPGTPQQPEPPKIPNANPLEGLPSFKSPPLASYLQKAAGSQGPVGFSKGGFVDVKTISAPLKVNTRGYDDDSRLC